MKSLHPQNGQISCPVCGHMMTKADEREENGDLFVWYECSRNDCDGQWLQKISDGFIGNSVSEKHQR